MLGREAGSCALLGIRRLQDSVIHCPIHALPGSEDIHRCARWSWDKTLGHSQAWGEPSQAGRGRNRSSIVATLRGRVYFMYARGSCPPVRSASLVHRPPSAPITTVAMSRPTAILVRPKRRPQDDQTRWEQGRRADGLSAILSGNGNSALDQPPIGRPVKEIRPLRHGGSSLRSRPLPD
ncbi:hypothetical protein BJX63DRAFT_99515 [Aspergillus granulosus]|uniref:Uncharacterized protein n=1 Tax=Aspergillus granulosus TaxID=176169 RepID=A0ABR4GUI9_9EURO